MNGSPGEKLGARYTEAMHCAEKREVNYIGSPKQSKIDYNVILKGQLILNMLSTQYIRRRNMQF